jgi:hypothetical protein
MRLLVRPQLKIPRIPRIIAIFMSPLLATATLSTHAQSLSDAFDQGAALGRSANAPARSGISGAAAQSHVPGYNTAPAQASYFGSPGISTPAAAAATACTGTGANDGSSAGAGGDLAAQTCSAIDFTQTNATVRPNFSITQSDPLLTGAKSIAADPLSIAGNIAGTYSSCTVQTTTTPDRFETAQCHQVRTTETRSCDKVLIVTPTQVPGCYDGQFLIRVTADPCPTCPDYLVFDFRCGANSYHMHAFTVARATEMLFMDLGSQIVPGTLNTEIPKTPGPSRIGKDICYLTHYSQSCSGTSCSIGAWFSNPCQGTSYYGVSTFVMPTTVSFTDAWDNQCAALDARTQ